MVRTARMAHGTLRLAVYNLRALVTIIPDDPTRLPVVREYDWAHKEQAIKHFEIIAEVTCDEHLTRCIS